ncbi:MAG: C40 family peptidase [Oscillospiraceae bacterium]|jgi:cell wall-associated NlpC family hydrolase|nr:C40 family peptidase [Oscillospiraceae bacterium]
MTAKKTLTGLAAHAKAQIGQIYWYGTFGQKPTLDLLMQKHKQYPTQITAERYDYAKRHHVGQDKRVYDCAGLVKSYFWCESPTGPPKYNAAQDQSAAGLKSCCGTKGAIGSLPEVAGLLLFIGTGHVGVYLGNGKAAEARGFSYGVVQTNLKNRAWDAWGKLDWLEDNTQKKEEKCTCNCECCKAQLCRNG